MQEVKGVFSWGNWRNLWKFDVGNLSSIRTLRLLFHKPQTESAQEMILRFLTIISMANKGNIKCNRNHSNTSSKERKKWAAIVIILKTARHDTREASSHSFDYFKTKVIVENDCQVHRTYTCVYKKGEVAFCVRITSRTSYILLGPCQVLLPNACTLPFLDISVLCHRILLLWLVCCNLSDRLQILDNVNFKIKLVFIDNVLPFRIRSILYPKERPFFRLTKWKSEWIQNALNPSHNIIHMIDAFYAYRITHNSRTRN